MTRVSLPLMSTSPTRSILIPNLVGMVEPAQMGRLATRCFEVQQSMYCRMKMSPDDVVFHVPLAESVRLEFFNDQFEEFGLNTERVEGGFRIFKSLKNITGA